MNQIQCGAVLITFFKRKKAIEMVELTTSFGHIQMTLARFGDILVRLDVRQAIKEHGFVLEDLSK